MLTVQRIEKGTKLSVYLIPFCSQYSSAIMMVKTRMVSFGLAGSGE